MNQRCVWVRGRAGRMEIQPVLTEQSCVSQWACMSISIRVCVCACVCCDMPISSTPHSTTHPTSVPPSYCLTPDPALPIPAGLVAKNRDEKRNRFLPLWGAVTVDPSLQLRAFSSGQLCPAGPLQPPRGQRPLK